MNLDPCCLSVKHPELGNAMQPIIHFPVNVSMKPNSRLYSRNRLSPGARVFLRLWIFDCAIENLGLNQSLNLIYRKMNRGLHDILRGSLILGWNNSHRSHSPLWQHDVVLSEISNRGLGPGFLGC